MALTLTLLRAGWARRAVCSLVVLERIPEESVAAVAVAATSGTATTVVTTTEPAAMVTVTSDTCTPASRAKTVAIAVFSAVP